MRSVLASLLLFFSVSAVAQTPPATSPITGSVRLRVENWKWFDTPGYDDRYAFFGALVRAGVTHRFNPRWDGQLELSVPAVAGLPSDAIAPAPQGQLGFGGTYYAANDDENAVALVLKQGWARVSFGSSSLRFGRFEFIEGSEVVPKDPTLAEVKRTRVAHRLIGNFGFTHATRSVDGAHFSWTVAPTTNVTAVAFRPTAGAFDMNANPELDVNIVYAAATRTTAAMDARLFAIAYQDDRDILKTDNRPLADRRADVDDVAVTTFGGHYARVMPLSGGTMDVVLWGALQSGEWGVLDHSARAGDVELGWRRGQLAYRVGAFTSSGDDDPNDGDHGTFFQILPTARQYARFPFYNAMNSRDVFAAATWKASPKLTLHSEVHSIRASEGRDLWYSGGGAFDDEAFGFAGRPTSGRTSLAHTIDLAADYAFTPKTTVSVYGALARGDAIIDAIYDGSDAALLYFEVTRRF